MVYDKENCEQHLKEGIEYPEFPTSPIPGSLAMPLVSEDLLAKHVAHKVLVVPQDGHLEPGILDRVGPIHPEIFTGS